MVTSHSAITDARFKAFTDFTHKVNSSNYYPLHVDQIQTISKHARDLNIQFKDERNLSIKNYFLNAEIDYLAVINPQGQRSIVEFGFLEHNQAISNFNVYQESAEIQANSTRLSTEAQSYPAYTLPNAKLESQSQTEEKLKFDSAPVSLNAPKNVVIDLVAPDIHYELIDNQLFISSNETVKIVITDIRGQVLGQGNIEGMGSTTIDLMIDNKANQLFIESTDIAGNMTGLIEYLPDRDPPALSDFYINDMGHIVLIFDEQLDDINLIDKSLLSVQVDQLDTEIESITLNGSNLTLVLQTPVFKGQRVDLQYTDATVDNDLTVIQDTSGNDALDFKIENIHNNSNLSPPSIDMPQDIHLFDNVANGLDPYGAPVVEEIRHQSTTNDANPMIEGKGIAGHTILIFIDEVYALSSTVDVNGQWAVESPFLADGMHHFAFIQQHPSGQQSSKTDHLSFIVDTQVDSVESLTPAIHQIIDIEGSDFIVSNQDIEDRILTVKGQLTGLYPDDYVSGLSVKIVLAESGQALDVKLTPESIDENGIWTADFALDGLELGNGQAEVFAVAEIKDLAGNSATLEASVQPFVIALSSAQEDTAEVNFELLHANYTLETVQSTQFLNILDVSDRLNSNLEQGTTISIAQPLDTPATFGRTITDTQASTINSEVIGKVVLSYADLSLLTVAKSYGIVLQKLDEQGQWQYHMAAPMNQTGVVASLGSQYALGVIDQQGNRTLTFDGLAAGEYRVSTYIVPSELTQLLHDFELSKLGADGTLLGQQNQDFLINAVTQVLGADSPSTQQLVGFIQTLLDGLNTLTLPISFILDRLLNLPILQDVLQALDQVVDTVVAPLVSNTLDVLRHLEINLSYSESYVQTSPITGNVLDNDFANEAALNLTQISVFDGYQYQSFDVQAGNVSSIQGQYGALSIHSDGGYSYHAFASSKDVNAIEFFKYKVRQNNLEQEVEFQIKINGQDQSQLSAVDDERYLDLIVEPSITEQELQSVTAGGLAYIGLGSVLDLDTIQIKNALHFDVAHDTKREIHLQAESGGVQVLTDFDLFIYKWNAEFQQYELHQQHANWFGVALLGGVSGEIAYTLDSGQYIAMIEPTRGVNALYGYTLKTTQDLLLDYSDPVAVYGQASGNVIHDINQNIGSKDYSPNQEVLYLTALNGQTIVQDQLNTGLSIEGQFGQLTLYANGDYVYTAYNQKSFNYGDQETFVYTVYDPILNQSKNAELIITLDLVHFNPESDSVNVDLAIDPSETYYANLSVDNTVTQGQKSTTGFGVVGIGLGSVVSAEIIANKPGLNISVQQGEQVSMQFSATGTSVVGVGNVSDLVIYKKNPSTGAYELYHSSESFLIVPLAVLGIPLGGIHNTPENVLFSEGEYVAYLTTLGVSVIGGNTLNADHMTVYDYNEVDGYTGLLEGALELTQNLSLISINDQVVGDQAIQIDGKYGTLSIHANGQYAYQVDNTIQPPQYGKIDTFSYVTTDQLTGQTQVSILNIKLSTIDAQADVLNPQGEAITTTADLINKFNEDAVVFESSSALTKSNTIQATSLDKFSKKIQFDLQADTESKGLKLNFEGLADVASAKIDLSYRLVMLKNSLGQTVNQVIHSNSLSQLSQAKLALELHDLAAGQYELQLDMPGKAGSLRYYGYELKVFNQYADQWVSHPNAEGQVIEGNLLANDRVSDDLIAHTILKINNKTIVLDATKTANEIMLTGQYGVLTVKSDGHYSYQANGQGGGKEIFVYELISPTGDTDKSTLEINVSKNVTGSSQADVIESGSSDDIYFLSEDADTVVFSLLNAADATGGNGSDQWKDFSDNDKIDLSALFDLDSNAKLQDFVAVETIDGNTVISIDRDGQSAQSNASMGQDQFEFTALLTLQAKDLSLEQLLQNNQIVY